MVRILIRPAFLIVITLSSALLAGCAGLSGDPYEQANGYVAEANEAIEEHNDLFEEARGTYDEAREIVEAGETDSEDGSGVTAGQEEEEIAQARETMEEAQDTLEEAREPLSELQDLDVDEEIIQYSVLLSESVSAQLSAENREIEFYGLLEQDPTLADTREEAEELLAEVGDGYEEARSSYDRAQELAAANPDLIQES